MAAIRPEEISSVIQKEIQAYQTDLKMESFARQLTDDAARHRLFDHFVLGIYALPGFVISYP